MSMPVGRVKVIVQTTASQQCYIICLPYYY